MSKFLRPGFVFIFWLLLFIGAARENWANTPAAPPANSPLCNPRLWLQMGKADSHYPLFDRLNARFPWIVNIHRLEGVIQANRNFRRYCLEQQCARNNSLGEHGRELSEIVVREYAKLLEELGFSARLIRSFDPAVPSGRLMLDISAGPRETWLGTLLQGARRRFPANNEHDGFVIRIDPAGTELSRAAAYVSSLDQPLMNVSGDVMLQTLYGGFHTTILHELRHIWVNESARRVTQEIFQRAADDVARATPRPATHPRQGGYFRPSTRAFAETSAYHQGYFVDELGTFRRQFHTARRRLERLVEHMARPGLSTNEREALEELFIGLSRSVTEYETTLRTIMRTYEDAITEIRVSRILEPPYTRLESVATARDLMAVTTRINLPSGGSIELWLPANAPILIPGQVPFIRQIIAEMEAEIQHTRRLLNPQP